MTEFISEIKTIPYENQTVYETLADLNNLEKLKDRIPADKIEDFTFDSNSCSFSIQPVGKVRFSIVEREPSKTIKLTADQAPMDVTMWIQLKETGEKETKMKLTMRTDLNPFLKPMLSKPLQEGINQMADILAKIPYETLA
ncbi:MAG: SRPBCC family protein [Candidatus Azobacteroides sp.]|nr:SRPBCC family protein [Candidatus Azobacteroides sp.]